MAGPVVASRKRSRSEPTKSERSTSRPNIIVYLVDTLREDRLGCYGHDRDVSPNIDRFAAGATLFENARAQSSWTLASVASIFTGVWPPAHGVVFPNVALNDDALTLAELLHGAGYLTAAIVANRFVTEEFGLHQGFQELLALELANNRSDVVLAETISWLNGRDRSKPFFLYVHTLDPHNPYLPSQEFFERHAADAGEMLARIRREPLRQKWEPTDSVRSQLLALYDALIAQNDAAFGRTLAYLEREDLFENSLIVFLSDHGEEFYEHRAWTHGASLFAETLNIPLIVKLPGQTIGKRVERIAQHIDLLPTLLDYLGLDEASFAGRSLLPDMLGLASDIEPPPVFSHTFRNKKENRSVIDGDWKYMERVVPGDSYEILVDWVADPRDHQNLVAEHRVRSDLSRLLISRELQRRRLVSAEEAVLDETTRNELRALGYLD